MTDIIHCALFCSDCNRLNSLCIVLFRQWQTSFIVHCSVQTVTDIIHCALFCSNSDRHNSLCIVLFRRWQMWWPLTPRMPSNASVPPTWKIPTPSFFVYRVSSCLPVCVCLSSVCACKSVYMSCVCLAKCLNWFLCPGVICVFVYVLVHMYACICTGMCVCVWLYFGMNYSFLNGGDQYIQGQTKKMVACTSLPVLVGSHRDTEQCKHMHAHTHSHMHARKHILKHALSHGCVHAQFLAHTHRHAHAFSLSLFLTHTHTHTHLVCFSLIGMCLHFQRCVWQMGHWMLSAATWQTWSARWTPAASEQFSCWQRSTWLRAVSTTQTGYSTIGTAWSVVVSAVM